MKKQAQYKTIAQDLLEQIQEGSLKPGEQLPTEAKLCEKYKVSRMTVNKALSSLVTQNFISRTAGKGSFVQDSSIIKDVNRNYSSFTKDVLSIEKKPGAILADYRILRTEDIPEIARKLELPASELVHFIHRIRTIDDVRVALSYTYIPCKYLPALNVTVLEASLYEYLDKHLNIRPYPVDYTFNALLPTQKQQTLLQTDSCALLKSSHLNRIESGELFEYTETFYAGNRYTYHFSL